MKYQLEPINVNAIERKSRLPSDVKRAIELETIIEITNERAKELTKLEESLHNIGSECSEIGDKFYRLWDELVKRVTIKTIVLGQRKDAPEWRKDEEITIYSGGIGCRYYRRNHRLSFDDLLEMEDIEELLQKAVKSIYSRRKRKINKKRFKLACKMLLEYRKNRITYSDSQKLTFKREGRVKSFYFSNGHFSKTGQDMGYSRYSPYQIDFNRDNTETILDLLLYYQFFKDKLKQEIRQWKKFRTRLYNLYQKYEKRASIFIAHKYL